MSKIVTVPYKRSKKRVYFNGYIHIGNGLYKRVCPRYDM